MLNNFYNPFHEKVESLNNKLKHMEDRLLGKIDNSDVFVGKTKHGDVVKMYVKGKPKYASIKDINPDDITLDQAKELLKYPIILGKHNNKDVVLNKGQYGFYLQYDGRNVSIKEELNLEESIKVIDNPDKKLIKKIVDKNMTYYINNGPYGPYLSYKKNTRYVNKPIKNIKPESITLKDIKKII